MSLLKPATNKMAFAKVGIYGSAGSGKTRTATEIAIGLHKAIGSKKPIVAFDTEPAFSFMLPIFQKENINLLIADESRALIDLMKFMDEAEKVSDIVIIDSITHIWRDAQDSYLKKVNMQRKAMGKNKYIPLNFITGSQLKQLGQSLQIVFYLQKCTLLYAVVQVQFMNTRIKMMVQVKKSLSVLVLVWLLRKN